MDITVDILLPTFNGEKYLEEQIESILNQNVCNFNLLIRDDQSTDRTCEILERLGKKDNRIIIVKDNLGNLGIVKNIEKLLMISKADFIFFSDQDDIWHADKLKIFLDTLKDLDTNAPILAYSNSLIYINDEKKNLVKSFTNKNKGINNALFNFYVQGASSMINRTFKEIILPFPNYVYIHDRYFHLVSELLGVIIYISESTMLYRQHDTNLIGAHNPKNKFWIFKALKRKFYLEEDRNLILGLSKDERFQNHYLDVYKTITSSKVGKFKKIRLLIKNKIKIRIIDIVRLVLN